MKKIYKTIFAAGVILALVAGLAGAEGVVLKDGARLEGSIISYDGKKLKIKTSVGTVEIDKGKLESVYFGSNAPSGSTGGNGASYDSRWDASRAEVVIDTKSKLMWPKKPGPSYMKWAQAYRSCEAAVIAGYDDWRMPSIDELRTLIVDCKNTEAGGYCPVRPGSDVNAVKEACSGCEMKDGAGYLVPVIDSYAGYYWSSSIASNQTGQNPLTASRDDSFWAWVVIFSNAEVSFYAGNYEHQTICVRQVID